MSTFSCDGASSTAAAAAAATGDDDSPPAAAVQRLMRNAAQRTCFPGASQTMCGTVLHHIAPHLNENQHDHTSTTPAKTRNGRAWGVGCPGDVG
eukprot:855046-Pelagomonas_calceolata.AAC.1